MDSEIHPWPDSEWMPMDHANLEIDSRKPGAELHAELGMKDPLIAEFEGMKEILQKAHRHAKKRGSDSTMKQLQKEAELRSTAEQEAESLRRALNEIEEKAEQERRASLVMSENFYNDIANMHAIMEKKSAKTMETMVESTQVEVLEQQLKDEKRARVALEAQVKLLEHQLKGEKDARMSSEMHSKTTLFENEQLSAKCKAASLQMEEGLQSIMQQMRPKGCKRTLDFEDIIIEQEGKLLEAKVELAKARSEIAALRQENAKLLQESLQLSEELWKERKEMKAIISTSALKMKKNKAVVNAKAQAEIDALKKENADLLESSMKTNQEFDNHRQEMQHDRQEMHEILADSVRVKQHRANVRAQAKIAGLKQEIDSLVQSHREMSDEFCQDRQEMKQILKSSAKLNKKQETELALANPAETMAASPFPWFANGPSCSTETPSLPFPWLANGPSGSTETTPGLPFPWLANGPPAPPSMPSPPWGWPFPGPGTGPGSGPPAPPSMPSPPSFNGPFSPPSFNGPPGLPFFPPSFPGMPSSRG